MRAEFVVKLQANLPAITYSLRNNKLIKFKYRPFAIERRETTEKNQIYIYILNIFFKLKYVQN
jgi:hypothetical protein